MADEVLKIITLADVSGAINELKKLDSAINKVGASSKKAQQTTAAEIPRLPPIGNILGPQFAKARAELDQLQGALGMTAAEASNTLSHMGALGPAMTALGGPMAIVTGAIAAQAIALATLGGAILQAGIQYDNTLKTIAGRTGETGAKLEALGTSFLGVFSSVPQSAGQVAEVVSLLHQRFDLAGKDLQSLSTDILNFSRITGTPTHAAVNGLVEIMSSWNVKIDEAPALLNKLTVAFQKTGIPVTELTSTLESSDAILKQYGFTLDTSIALIANLKKTGADIPRILTGLNVAAPKFAAAGISPEAGLLSAIEQIQTLPSNQALALSKQLFGRGAANEFFDAIRSGSFDLQAMNIALDESGGALDRAAAASLTLSDQFEILKHNAEALMTPLGSTLVNIIENVMAPAFVALALPIYQNILLLERFLALIGMIPAAKLSTRDIESATHIGPKGAAPAKSAFEIAQLSGKVPAGAQQRYGWERLMQVGRRGGGGGEDSFEKIAKARQAVDEQIAALNHKALSGIAAQFDEIDSRFRKIIGAEQRTGGATRPETIAAAEQAATAAKIAARNQLFAKAGLTVSEERGFGVFGVTAGKGIPSNEQIQKDIDATLEVANKAYIEQIDNEEKLRLAMAATENERLGRIASMQDELAILQAAAAGRNKHESEIFELMEKQRQARRGVFGPELEVLNEKQQFEQLRLMQNQYDETFAKIKGQAEGVFDAIFTRGKKGFAGLLDYLKATFFTKLKDLFGDLVATLFTGTRPGAGGGGGIFGGLFSGISGLFGGLRGAGGGGGGINLGGVFGGGNLGGGVFSLAGGGARGGFGGIGSLLGLGGAGAGLAGAGTAGELALPTSIFRPEVAAGSTGGGLGGTLGAFFTNPFTIAAGIGIAATIAFLKLRKTREEKFRAEILRDFALNVPDSRILKQIKQAGEAAFGKEADKKRFETLRLDQVQGLLLNYATASGQDPSRLPLYQRFNGGLGIAGRSISFDPSRGVPAFGSGGIVTHPTLALVAEKGPEAIVPLARGANGGLGGITIENLNIDATGAASPESTARAVQHAVQEGMRAVLERGGLDRVLVKRVNKALGGDYQRGPMLGSLIGN